MELLHWHWFITRAWFFINYDLKWRFFELRALRYSFTSHLFSKYFQLTLRLQFLLENGMISRLATKYLQRTDNCSVKIVKGDKHKQLILENFFSPFISFCYLASISFLVFVMERTCFSCRKNHATIQLLKKYNFVSFPRNDPDIY